MYNVTRRRKSQSQSEMRVCLVRRKRPSWLEFWFSQLFLRIKVIKKKEVCTILLDTKIYIIKPPNLDGAILLVTPKQTKTEPFFFSFWLFSRPQRRQEQLFTIRKLSYWRLKIQTSDHIHKVVSFEGKPSNHKSRLPPVPESVLTNHIYCRRRVTKSVSDPTPSLLFVHFTVNNLYIIQSLKSRKINQEYY